MGRRWDLSLGKPGLALFYYIYSHISSFKSPTTFSCSKLIGRYMTAYGLSRKGQKNLRRTQNSIRSTDTRLRYLLLPHQKYQNTNQTLNNWNQLHKSLDFNSILSLMSRNKEQESSREAGGHTSFDHFFAFHSQMRTRRTSTRLLYSETSKDYIP